jgi:hypothetical protein
MTTAMTIRRADLADLAALDRLAALDSAYAPTGDVLVGEVGGELWAALEIDSGRVIADPFRPSGELLFLLVERARQLRAASAPRRPRRLFAGHRRHARPAT